MIHQWNILFLPERPTVVTLIKNIPLVFLDRIYPKIVRFIAGLEPTENVKGFIESLVVECKVITWFHS